jgi:hypothetical protein
MRSWDDWAAAPLPQSNAPKSDRPLTIFWVRLTVRRSTTRCLALVRCRATFRQVLISTVIGIALASNQQTALDKIQCPAHRDVMIATIGDRGKCRAVLAVVQTHVQLDRAFAAAAVMVEPRETA